MGNHIKEKLQVAKQLSQVSQTGSCLGQKLDCINCKMSMPVCSILSATSARLFPIHDLHVWNLATAHAARWPFKLSSLCQAASESIGS